MTNLFHWLRIAVGALEEADARYALIGGMAVSVHTQPRATHDVDLAVAAEDDLAAQAVCGHLLRCGFRVAAELDHTKLDRMATMRLVPPGIPFSDDDEHPLLVDLVFMASGIEPEVVRDAQPMPIAPGLIAPVVPIPHLIAMKTLSASEQRLKDLADLQALVVAATDQQIADSRALAQLIMDRNVHSGRDLLAELHAHVQRWR